MVIFVAYFTHVINSCKPTHKNKIYTPEWTIDIIKSIFELLSIDDLLTDSYSYYTEKYKQTLKLLFC